ncbi:hypothetical protein ABG768_027657 [Culter alburnus]|uniref:Uncharacterized protein n=1 Tax=Culter alburnus TaxID=194366 RepID=A0AAW2A8U5_CULAL
MQTVCVCWGALAATDECLIISTPAVHSKKSIIKAWGIFQFDAQQAEPEIKGSYVSSTQTSLPEQASVRELSFSKREASPPQTTQSHFCLPARVCVCVSSTCLRVKADAMPLTCSGCRGRSLFFSFVCVCVTKFAFKKYL